MQIKTLELKNFKQYRDIKLEFPEGLLGFIGKNGAGKSTVFDAIFFALYAKIDVQREQIKHDHAADSEHVMVKLSFEDKGVEYIAVRELRGKNGTAKAELFIDNKSEVTGANEVTKQINKILKIDAANFKNSFFSQQKDVTSLLDSKPTEREKNLRKMLGFEKLDTLVKKIKDESKVKSSEIKGKQDELLSPERISALNSEIAAFSENETKIQKQYEAAGLVVSETEKKYTLIKKQLEEAEAIKEQHENYNKELAVNSERTNGCNEKIELTNKEIENLEKNKIEHDRLLPKQVEYNKVRNEIDALQKQKVSYQNKINLEGNHREYEENECNLLNFISDCQVKIASYNNAAGLIKSAEEKIKNEKEKLKLHNEIREEKSRAVTSFNDRINEKTDRLNHIKEIGKDSPCPECERPLEEHYDKLIEKYENEAAEIEKLKETKLTEISEAEVKISAINKEIDSLNKELDGHRKDALTRDHLCKELSVKENELAACQKKIQNTKAEIKALGEVIFDEDILSSKQKEMKALEEINNQVISLAAEIKNIPSKKKQLADQQKQKQELKLIAEDICKKITELKFNSAEFVLIKNERDKKEKELDTAKSGLNDIKYNLMECRKNLSDKKKELERDNELREKIDLIVKEIELLERLSRAVNEFKEKITSSALPDISREASRLFSKITKGRYDNLQITGTYDFLVNREDKPNADLSTLSGGEKDLACLCLRIAIAKKISVMAGRKNLGFFALDEVFGSQDEERREELMNALTEISKEFKQIFVVSHNQDVQEEFQQKFIFSKTGSYSTANYISA